MTIVELRNKRAKLVADARALIEKASSEKRDLNADENTQYAAIMADVDALKVQIDREEHLSALETEMRSSTGSITRNQNTHEQGTITPERLAFRAYLRTGERRATTGFNAGTAEEGGALVPTEFVNELFTTLASNNVVRQIARVLPPVNSNAVIPSFAPTGTAAWIAEEGDYTESDHSGFAKNAMGAHKVGSLVKVSEELVQDASIDVEALLTQEFGRQIGETEEAGYVVGDGTGKPTGVTITAQTGKTSASSTAVTADEILDFFHSLKPAYRARASFLMNDTTSLAVRKLKSATDGQYIWQPGLQAGTPDRLLGRPVFYSVAMPEIAAAQKVMAFGDFSQYVIVDRREVTIQRLNELFAAKGQIGFKLFRRTDGKLLIPEAIKVLVMKAA